ncbi:molecular chaperone DnaJ [Anaeromyxobacter sp. Fw109-5]|uniref:molecular chaperone DnaJ n=1 Tax=Anaeromyxobacter sp. (strain Fw109-5) TaxID=404589 RepID=UPI0000ED7E77|nr:molecular chaperone DnaJ [Anaeromyxobacter sp. Fw109-5]ABS25033.1 heat shock protein DnaJ-like protein [Anaeromyxobacter sp. Fw109-5]
MGDSRARSLRAALVHVGRPPPDPAIVAAEARLRAVLDEVTALDLEVEALSAALARFAGAYERSLREAFQEVQAAERLVRRIQTLSDRLAAIEGALRADAPAANAARRAGDSAVAAAAARAARARGLAAGRGGEDAEPGAGPDEVDEADVEEGAALEPEELALKRLHRSLARLLHPDLARDEGARGRLGELMARVNAAYEAGDLATLELMAERLGAGELDPDVSPEERRAHLEKRAAALERIRLALERERERLLGSDTARLLAESRRREQAGGDLLAETRAELAEEARAAYADALARLERVGTAARAVARARTAVMTKIVRRGPTGARRTFDPLAEGGLVRMGAARLDRQRATPAARELARRLEEAEPVEAALTLLAFFAEEAGGRAPDAIARAEGWAATWERLRPVLPEAQELPRVLGRLPRHLVLGARAHGDELVAGVQLAEPELLAGVQIALEREGVAALGREVLAALGPEEACEGCGAEGPARHLLRTRGLDERHGLACAGCGAILRSYWRYGELDGLEALAPHALRLGLVAEVTIQLAGTAIGFQLLPAQREALTAAALLRRFADLYLVAYDVELEAGATSLVAARGGALPMSAPLPAGARVRLALDPSAGMTAEALLDLLRHRIERRFRP